jgi:hypothetical protein
MALLSRWYVVAVVVGVVMGALPILFGVLFMYVGDVLRACGGEIGCAWLFLVGVVLAPYEAVCATLAAGLVARRLASVGAVSTSRRWRSSFGAGFLALFPAGLLTIAMYSLR